MEAKRPRLSTETTTPHDKTHGKPTHNKSHGEPTRSDGETHGETTTPHGEPTRSDGETHDGETHGETTTPHGEPTRSDGETHDGEPTRSDGETTTRFGELCVDILRTTPGNWVGGKEDCRQVSRAAKSEATAALIEKVEFVAPGSFRLMGPNDTVLCAFRAVAGPICGPALLKQFVAAWFRAVSTRPPAAMLERARLVRIDHDKIEVRTSSGTIKFFWADAPVKVKRESEPILLSDDDESSDEDSDGICDTDVFESDDDTQPAANKYSDIIATAARRWIDCNTNGKAFVVPAKPHRLVVFDTVTATIGGSNGTVTISANTSLIPRPLVYRQLHCTFVDVAREWTRTWVAEGRQAMLDFFDELGRIAFSIVGIDVDRYHIRILLGARLSVVPPLLVVVLSSTAPPGAQHISYTHSWVEVCPARCSLTPQRTNKNAPATTTTHPSPRHLANAVASPHHKL